MNLRALLELMRVSNLPTVWSNAWMGWLVGNVGYQMVMVSEGDLTWAGLLTEPTRLLSVGLLAAFSMSLLYCAGMALNDYIDRDIDLAERPGRPIPSGRVSSRMAISLVLLLVVGGLAGFGVAARLSGAYGSGILPPCAFWIAVTLVATIGLYNRLHQHKTIGFLLMAACRGLLVLACAALAFTPLSIEKEVVPNAQIAFWLLCAAPAEMVAGYTVLISIVARSEATLGRKLRWSTPRIVMNMIALMPLIDMLALIFFGLWPASLVCVACAGLTKLGHRRIAGS